jgi:hypothetical protein
VRAQVDRVETELDAACGDGDRHGRRQVEGQRARESSPPAERVEDDVVAYPELADDATLLDRAVRDLDQQGLSSIALRAMMSSDGIMPRRTLALGEELLEFITEPTV